MTWNEMPQPQITSRDEWLAQRKTLLAREKEVTRQRDRVSAERRRLPMVKIEKEYVFDGPDGKCSLADLFDARRQLIVYHFMFDPEWDSGCPGCTSYVDALAPRDLRDREDCAGSEADAPGEGSGLVSPAPLVQWPHATLPRSPADPGRRGADRAVGGQRPFA